MPRRRGPGEGSIRKKSDGRWEVALATGRSNASGNPERVWATAPTRQEAVRRLDELRQQVLRGHSKHNNQVRFSRLVDDWLLTKSALQDRTIYTYRREVEPAVRLLGHLRVSKITSQDIHGLLQEMQATGLSHRAQSRALMHLGGLFDMAIRLDLIVKNPAKLVRIGKPRVASPNTGVVLSKDDVRRLQSVVQGGPLETPVHLLIALGLRRGELLGLRWSAVDLTTRTMRIQTVYKPTGSGSSAVLGVPKTARSRRTIPFSGDVAEVLENHKRHGQTSADLVFVTRNDTPLHPRNFSRDVVRAMKRAGVAGSVHTLRHTHASLVLSAGLPVEVVSHHLGHAQISTTMNIYRHLLAHERTAPAPSLRELLDGA